MKAKFSKQRVVASIEHASILRKFTIFFLLMSLLPMVVLYFFYLQLKEYGEIQLTVFEFNLTLTFIVLGIIVGYASMRTILTQLIALTDTHRRALESIVSPEKIRELSEEKNEIAVLAQSFSAITNRLEENVRSLELAKRTLHSVMTKVGEGLSNMQNIDTFLELILETVTEALAGKVGVLLLLDDVQKKGLVVKTVYGAEYDPGRQMKIKILENTTFDAVLNSKRGALVSQANPDEVVSRTHMDLFQAPLVCTPLIMKDKVIGILSVSGRRNNKDFEETELGLLSNLAAQTAVSIENSRLNKDIEKTYFETISALALAVDAKDKYSHGHLDRVARHCVLIARKLGLDEQDIQTLRDGARLHDLGKIGIPDEVLNKRESLNQHDWELMRKHTEIGESIIKPIRSLQNLCDIIRHHHEKLDGAGYPDGLKGDEITPLVRILMVADIYDALTSDRPYRSRMTRQKAFEELRKMKDQIDQDIVEVFIEALEEQNPS